MKRLAFILPLILIGCKPVYNLTSTEYVKVEVRDTIVFTKLVPQFVKIQTKDTTSHLENMYAFSDVRWSSGTLYHSLGNKAVEVPVSVQIKTITKDKIVKVNELTKEQEKKIKDYDQLAVNNDKLSKSNKNKSALLWKLYGLIAILVLWIFRKPILTLLRI